MNKPLFRAEKEGLADILEAENGPHMTGYNMTSENLCHAPMLSLV